MHKIFCVCILSFFVSNFTFAAPHAITNCPTVKAIIKTGLDTNRILYNKKDSTWMLGNTAKFDSAESWVFTIQKIKAKDKQSAYKIATDSLSSLEFIKKYTSVKGTVCMYKNKHGNPGVAITY